MGNWAPILSRLPRCSLACGFSRSALVPVVVMALAIKHRAVNRIWKLQTAATGIKPRCVRGARNQTTKKNICASRELMPASKFFNTSQLSYDTNSLSCTFASVSFANYLNSEVAVLC
jgi:hypothetical protein